MKDPAILFYTGDFLTGTLTLTDQEVGQYIRLLCLMHQKGGYLSENDMIKMCKPQVFDCVKEKFLKTDDGFFYNERLLKEIGKRKDFCDMQKTKINKRWNNTNAGNTAVIPKAGNTTVIPKAGNTTVIPKAGNTTCDSIDTNNVSNCDKSIENYTINDHNCDLTNVSNREMYLSNPGNTKAGNTPVLPIEDEDEDEDGVIIINNNLENENENLKIKNTYSAPQTESDYDFSDLKKFVSKNNLNRWSHHFRIFWEIYPKKEGMEATQELFFTIMESGQVTLHKFFESVKDYNTFCQVEYGDDYPRGKFIKQPLNWLRDKCWTIDWREKTKDATTQKKNPNMATHLFGN